MSPTLLRTWSRNPLASRLGAAAVALTLSLIVAPSASAQIGRELAMPDRTVGVLTYLIVWAIGTAVLLALTFVVAWVIPARDAERIYATAHSAPSHAVGLGLLLAIGLPLTIVALSLTIVGIPLAIATAILAVPLGAAGYVASGWLLGRAIAARRSDAALDQRGRVLWAVIGVGILRLLALLPFVDMLVLVVVCAIGIGTLFTTYGGAGVRRDARRIRRGRDEDVGTALPVPGAAGA